MGTEEGGQSDNKPNDDRKERNIIVDPFTTHKNVIEKDLNTNPRYKEFFSRYNPESIKSFIKYYSERKAHVVRSGASFKEKEEKKILKYINLANELLWEIQQKKLFNLQCEWRAGQIELPGIETTAEFLYWEKYIRVCSFLPPISEDEYDLYAEYILSDDFDIDNETSTEWQNYDMIKYSYKNEEESLDIPAWYMFYDSRMGTSVLLTLPDERGDKEEFYLELVRNEAKVKNKQKVKPAVNTDPRPSFNYYREEVLDEFIELFEDNTTKDYFRAAKSFDERSVKASIDVEHAYQTLLEAGNVEVVYAGSWHETLIKTAHKYEKELIREAFDRAYRNYLNRLNMNIGFDPDVSEKDEKYVTEFVKDYKERLLRGRVLNNESGDFDF